MKTVWKVWGAMLALAIIASFAWLAVAHLWGPPLDAWPLIHIDDESVTIGSFGAVHGALALAGVIVALLVVVTVVPLVVALALGIAALGIALGAAAAAFGVLIPLSPFILIGWLVWRVLRTPKPAAAVEPGTSPVTSPVTSPAATAATTTAATTATPPATIAG